LSAAWRIKESLPHVLLYLIVRYRPDGHFSRKSFRKWLSPCIYCSSKVL